MKIKVKSWEQLKALGTMRKPWCNLSFEEALKLSDYETGLVICQGPDFVAGMVDCCGKEYIVTNTPQTHLYGYIRTRPWTYHKDWVTCSNWQNLLT